MSISAKDIAKLEQVMKAEGPAHYRNRYVPGAEHVGIYRIFMIWPDKLKEVEEVDGEWREAAITFLEVNPRYFRSGYDKAQLLRCLKRADLSPKHKQRLKAVLLDVVGRPSGVEFRQYCQLAARLASNELATALSKLVKSEDDGVRRQASWMLEHVEEA
ncbi:MAG: hypothetical protein RLZZ178_487 [Verrucomicrobiota bacterium]|jgi:hypothetical protein